MSIQAMGYVPVQDNRIEVKFHCLPCCLENRVEEILCFLDVLFSNLPFYLPSQRIYLSQSNIRSGKGDTCSGKGYSLHLRIESSSSLDENLMDDLDYLYYKACKDNPRLRDSYVHLVKSPCLYP
jgi:hypothetical protein